MSKRKNPLYRDSYTEMPEDVRDRIPLRPPRRCQCEHVNCHPDGNCHQDAVTVEVHFGIRQSLCYNCSGKSS